MKKIKLRHEKQAIVYDEWDELLIQYAWSALRDQRTGKCHAVRYLSDQRMYMENHIAAVPKGRRATHRDGDPLNNQRKNLRLVPRPKHKAHRCRQGRSR